MKDKLTGSTHEERVLQRKKQKEAVRLVYRSYSKREVLKLICQTT